MAILLSSIMTFGSLAEQYELVSMKSSGISLLKIMRPLTVTAVLLTGVAFAFANWITPVAFLKSRTLLWDITEKKPALELRPNVFFNAIDGYSIRIKSKNTETSELKDVLIYDHDLEYGGNRRVIRAESGLMAKSDDGRSLVLRLQNGSSYEEVAKTPTVQSNFPHVSNKFDRQELRIDLSGMKLKRSDEAIFKQGQNMLNIAQLRYVEDSLDKDMLQKSKEYTNYLTSSYYPSRDSNYAQIKKADLSIVPKNDTLTFARLDVAINLLNNAKTFTEREFTDEKDRTQQLNRYVVERHAKYSISLACLVLFFIGAPLGAIIRKGGLGLPVVFAVIFFLLFHVLTITGKKMAIAGVIPNWAGMWLNMAVLGPVAVFLTYKANNDSPLFDRETYIKLIRFFSKKQSV